jgi:hypothetical protein
MRKLVAIFFLLILPLQWTTAAVAAYCLHEQDGKAQQHIGHHAHEHQASTAQTDSDPGNTDFDAGFDSDCPSCHAHFAQAVIDADQLMLLASQVLATMSYRAFLPTPPPGSLFRPPLVDLA